VNRVMMKNNGLLKWSLNKNKNGSNAGEFYANASNVSILYT